MRLCTLKRSSEFHRIRGGVRWSGPGFLIEGKARAGLPAPGAPATGPEVSAPGGNGLDAATPAVTRAPVRSAALNCRGPRFGFTITRKLGGAVVRNRIRRRLREALRILDAGLPQADFDYVVVARKSAAERSFADLGRDFRSAFAHMHRQPGASTRRRG